MKIKGIDYDIFYLNIFNSGVIFIVAPDKEAFLKAIPSVMKDAIADKNHRKQLTIDLMDCISKDRILYPGTTFEDFTSDGVQYLIVILRKGETKEKLERIIPHEMFHTVYKLCKERGIEDEETQAYMLEYLCGKAFSTLREFNEDDKKVTTKKVKSKPKKK